jgi:tetratricopeptide (TPR) repeat protein
MRIVMAVTVATALVCGGVTAAQQPNLAARVRQGWEALNADRASEAAQIFDEALQKAPNEPALLVGAATAAHLLGRSESARVHLLNALKLDPKFMPASLLLGELLYRTGDLNGAISAYDDALRYAPGDGRLTRRLEVWRKEADLHDRFDQKFGVHFTILFEGPAEAELAARAVEILERSYWRLGAALFAYPPDIITVVLYTQEQFRDITQSPAWAGGAFDGRIRMPVRGALQNSREFERVLAHELTHAFIRSIGGRGVPYWLDEGLAMYFDGSDLAARRALVKKATQLHQLTRLEASFASLNDAGARLAYAQSAIAVERLVEIAGTTAVVSLLTDLGAGMPLAKAFERNVFMTYADFQQSLVNPL